MAARLIQPNWPVPRSPQETIRSLSVDNQIERSSPPARSTYRAWRVSTTATATTMRSTAAALLPPSMPSARLGAVRTDCADDQQPANDRADRRTRKIRSSSIIGSALWGCAKTTPPRAPSTELRERCHHGLAERRRRNHQNAVRSSTGSTTASAPTSSTPISSSRRPAPIFNSSFTPTTGQQEEVGIKYQPNAKSLFTLDAYNLTQQNVLTPDPGPTSGPVRARTSRPARFAHAVSSSRPRPTSTPTSRYSPPTRTSIRR